MQGARRPENNRVTKLPEWVRESKYFNTFLFCNHFKTLHPNFVRDDRVTVPTTIRNTFIALFVQVPPIRLIPEKNFPSK